MSLIFPELANELGVLRASPLFDADWYLSNYPDVALLGMDAAEHYLQFGASLLRDPGPEFNTRAYLNVYPELWGSHVNPLLHYISHGAVEARTSRPATHQIRIPNVGVALDTVAGALALATRIAGLAQRRRAEPTVLVCAHMMTKHLFGGERSLLDVVEGLAALGYNVIATVPAGDNAAYIQALRESCIQVLQFNYGWWRSECALDHAAVAVFAAIIAEFRVDAVHANTIMMREALLAARRMNIPGVVHVRELVAHDAALCQSVGLSPDQIAASVISAADYVIANSQATARHFNKPGKTFVVPNTVDTAEFDIPIRTGEDGIGVALVSSNLPKKGVFEFLEVARLLADQLPQVRFHLFGPDNVYTKALAEDREAGRLPPNVVLAGYAGHPLDAMQACDIVVNLSHFQESFGRTVLEAMAARRPVVAYDWGALGELVVDGVTGFLVPFGDVTQVADRIATLCRVPEMIDRMGTAGRQRAVDLYGKPQFASQLGDAYRRILEPGQWPQPVRETLPRRGPSDSILSGKSLKVGYFLWHFPVPSETFVLNELRILVQQGHDVHVFCKRSPFPEFIPDFPVSWTTVDSVEDFAQALIETGRTVVHSHFVFPTVTDMVWPACEAARIPFTFIAHAQDIFRYANDRVNRVGEVARSKYCLAVLAPSRFHRNYLIQRGVPVQKIIINPNGIDPALYRSAEEGSRYSRKKRSVCAVHRFTEKKGLIHLIEAARLLKAEDIHVHLYGYGDLEKDYRNAIAELGLVNVHLHGEVTGRKHLMQVFSEHDLFACPSVRAEDGDMDGIPTVLMEAMASGLPVLSTAVSGIPDLVRDEVTGLVCDPNPASIASKIRQFFAMSEAQVESIADRALKLIERDYHAGRLTGALLRLWQHRTIDLMIVSWNNLPELREVIRRLFEYTRSPFHLVVCDNGSEPDVLVYLSLLHATHENVTIVFNRDNAKVGPGTNICLHESDSQYAVYVCGKEGFVIDFGWERLLIDYMDDHPDVGLAGTLVYSPSYLFGRQYPAGVAEFPRFRNPEFASENPDREFCHVQGGFFVLRRAMFDAIGGFSNEVPHNYTDVEFSYYVESRGWSLGSAPGMLSLYNKTRPGIFNRLDEDIAAVHPPRLIDLPVLDGISSRTGAFCNQCGMHAHGFLFNGGTHTCSGCLSAPADRSLHRYLCESMLTYRRLPAVAIGLGASLHDFWHQQFQPALMTMGEATARLRDHKYFDLATGGRKLAYVALGPDDDVQSSRLVGELSRVLAADGFLLIVDHSGESSRGPRHAAIVKLAKQHGLVLRRQVRYASQVSRYDFHPLLEFTKDVPCA